MIYIILVNWRRYLDTIECLESLMRIDGPAFKVIVVDNQSDASGVEQIRLWSEGEFQAEVSGPAWRGLSVDRLRQPTLSICAADGFSSGETSQTLVTVIRVVENTGFAAANNVGLRIALSDAVCSHAWLLNNDTVVDRSALAALLARAGADGAIGLCGSTLLYYDAPDTIQSLGGVFNPLLGRGTNLCMGKPLAQLPPTEAVEARLEYLIGASMLVTRGFLEDVGLMEESYFLYFEELNWSRRAKRRFKHAWARSSFVYHKEGASIGTNSRARPSDTSLYCFNLNFLRFLRVFHAYFLPVGVVVVVLKLLGATGSGDRKAAEVFKRVIYDFLWSRRNARDGLMRFRAR